MTPRLTIQPHEWEENGPKGDPTARLRVTVDINGVPHHCEAYAVEMRGTVQEQVASLDVWGDTIGAVYGAVGGDGAWASQDIKGRQYVLIVTPHCNNTTKKREWFGE